MLEKSINKLTLLVENNEDRDVSQTMEPKTPDTRTIIIT